MTRNDRFSQVVFAACHDLRTPLATVYGFARTLARVPLDDASARYVAMIDTAAGQLTELLEELALVARIEGRRFQPTLVEADSLELARAAAAELEEGEVTVEGDGERVRVDVDVARRAIARLAAAARRHGGIDAVAVTVRGPVLELAPIGSSAAAVVTAAEVRELGPVAAVSALEALGASLTLEGDRLLVHLPAP